MESKIKGFFSGNRNFKIKNTAAVIGTKIIETLKINIIPINNENITMLKFIEGNIFPDEK